MNNNSGMRFVTNNNLPGEHSQEVGLRPISFNELIGQKKILDNLKVFVKATLARGESLDHILLCGQPGLGKTTLAHIIAHELSADIHITSGPALEKKDLAGILSNLKERDILFIDEIHRLQPIIEENLYPAMEDFRFDLVIGTGIQARNVPMPLPHFTLIGATTRAGLLTGPMRDRFGYTARMSYYSFEELTQVILRSAKILNIECLLEGAKEIAKRSRGTPRIANRFLRRLRDFADIQGEGVIDFRIAQIGLESLGVDPHGFDQVDREFLNALIQKFSGGPVGIDSLGATIGEEIRTLESVYEPFLLQEGYIQRTPRGRMATALTYKFFNLPYIEK